MRSKKKRVEKNLHQNNNFILTGCFQRVAVEYVLIFKQARVLRGIVGFSRANLFFLKLKSFRGCHLSIV